MSEIIYNKCSRYNIEGIEIEIISEKFDDDFVYNTYYNIDGNIYCLGDEEDDIQAAIMAYEHFFNIQLTDNKISKIYDEFMKNHESVQPL